MTPREQFCARTAELAKECHPALTAKQAAAIAERIAAQEDESGHPLWTYSGGSAPAVDVMIQTKIENVAAAAPELVRTPPTPDQLVGYQAAEFEKKHGRAMRPIELLNAQRLAAELDPDARLAKVPSDAQLPEAREPAKVSTPLAPPMPDDIGAIDAEIERRTGKTAAELLPSQRRAYHDKIKAELRAAERAEQSQKAAAASVRGDLDKLPPAQRMTLARKAAKDRA